MILLYQASAFILCFDLWYSWYNRIKQFEGKFSWRQYKPLNFTNTGNTGIVLLHLQCKQSSWGYRMIQNILINEGVFPFELKFWSERLVNDSLKCRCIHGRLLSADVSICSFADLKLREGSACFREIIPVKKTNK